MSVISGKTFVAHFEKEVPLWLAEEKDPVGLHVGDLTQTVRKILVTLDLRPEVVQEAIRAGADFILAHHPPIFRPLARLNLSDPQTRMYADLIKHDIRVYAAHTNLDNAQDGMNDWLAEALGLEEVEIMDVTHTFSLKKMNVYVPETHYVQVRDALTAAGAGHITDNYIDCSYTLSGIGRFTPVGGAHPTIGQVGEPEEVHEKRIEVVLKESDRERVMAALFQAHPYEEPVYETYTIDQLQPQSYGLGRVGNLPEAQDLKAFVEHVKKTFHVSGLRAVVPNPDVKIRRVAICGGDAGKYYRKALAKGADVYITGDVYYHTAHDMEADGLTVIDPGHNIEKICIPKLVEKINGWKDANGWELEVIPSQVNTDPFVFDTSL